MKRLLALTLSALLITGCTAQGPQDQKQRATRGLGYLSGASTMPEETGVVTRTRAPSEDVYVVSSGDTHTVRLMNDSGTVLHTWPTPYSRAFDSKPPLDIYEDTAIRIHRRVTATPDGGLIVTYSGAGMAKINRDGSVAWSKLNWAHHETAVDFRGRIYALPRKPRAFKRRHRHGTRTYEMANMDERVAVYSPDGEKIASLSIYDAIKRSRFYGLNRLVSWSQTDMYHTNDIDLIGENAPPIFEGGDVLLSLHDINAVVSVDLETEKVTGAVTGLFDKHHDPDILPSGNLLVFDNSYMTGESRVTEIDTTRQSIEWTYRSPDFYTACCGYSERLDNGNTFIVETYDGRAFEVTPDGTIVWEWINPHTAYGSEDQVARVLVKRYSRVYFGDGFRTEW